MFQCSRCGAQNYIGQGYCWNCNERFQYNCPYCNVAVDPSMQYCSYCRAVLPWPSQPQATPPAGSYPQYQSPQGQSSYDQYQPGYQQGQAPSGPNRKKLLLVMLAVVTVLALATVVIINLPNLLAQPVVLPQIQQPSPGLTFDNTFGKQF